ncbi:MAG: heterocycloanthracin/sonorensin family bacteriocin [Fuerstiella sp.]
MFGFLSPQKHIPEYRRSYARVCQYQRQLFGITSLPFVSFEAAFLYQLAADFELIPTLPVEAPECCRLRRISRTDSRNDETVGSFAAAFGVMLAGIKLQDDVADSGRWFNRLAWWKYRRQVNEANQLLATFDPQLTQRVTSVIAEHTAVEYSGCSSIEEYSTPTGRGFAAVFASFAACVQRNGSLPESQAIIDAFSEIGVRVGRAIIAWDCAVDFDKDRIRGEFNPLQSQADVRRSLGYSLLQLSQVGWLLPEGSTSGSLISSVSDRVRTYIHSPPRQHPVRRWERWGLIRERGFSYARCDGCEVCCAVGECCECAGGAGEAAVCCAGAGDGGACCCVECCGEFACCGANSGSVSDAKKRAGVDSGKADTPGPYVQYHGKQGITAGDLNPAGYVTFDGEKIPGRTASGAYLPSRTDVRVVRTDPFGVTVVVLDVDATPN